MAGFDDLVDDSARPSGKLGGFDSLKEDSETYGTPGQQAIAGLEGVAQGIAGPLAPLAERALGVDPQGIRLRAEHNPWTHGLGEAAGFGAGLFTGSGEAALLGKAGQGVAKLVEGESIAAKLASGAARMGTEMGLYQAGDEATKAILQDPNQTVGSAASRIGLSALLGGTLGGGLTGLSTAAKSTINSQFIQDFTDRLSARGAGIGVEEKGASLGEKLADHWHEKLGAHALGDTAGAGLGGLLGHATGIPGAGIGGAYVGKEVLGPAFTSIIKPMLEKGANLPAVQGAMSYLNSAIKGNNTLVNAAADVFGAEAKTLPHLFPDSKKIEQLDERLKDVSENPSKMLEVAGNVGDYLPDHAQAASHTAMAAVNYLNSQRPTNGKMSPLDSDLPVSQPQKDAFDRTLSLAQQPLVAFQHIKNGTLVPQDINTVKTIYPAFYNKMSQELMNAMTNHISEGGTVPYRLRQSASLFLGQPLDSTMTPESIQSIQAIYLGKKAAQAQEASQPSPKRGTSKLSKISSNMQTMDQSRAARAAQT